jgi:hypothetical protein
MTISCNISKKYKAILCLAVEDHMFVIIPYFIGNRLIYCGIDLTIKQMNWLIGRKSKLAVENKILI